MVLVQRGLIDMSTETLEQFWHENLHNVGCLGNWEIREPLYSFDTDAFTDFFEDPEIKEFFDVFSQITDDHKPVVDSAVLQNMLNVALTNG